MPGRDSGRVTSVSENDNGQTTTRSFTYNSDNQLTAENQGQVGATVEYAYYDKPGQSGPVGSIKTLTLKQGSTALLTLTYLYDTVTKRLQKIQVQGSGGGQQTFTYGYLANTDLISSLDSNGIASRTWSYETTTGRLSQSNTSAGATTLYQANYGYNNNDHRTSETVTGPAADAHAWTIGYDTLDQLQSIKNTSDNSSVYSYNFDGLGNRTDLGTVNNVNEYTDAGEYDSRGNLTKWDGKTYQYDGLDRMVLAEDSAISTNVYADGALRATFGYDSDGRRTWKKSFKYDADANEGAGAWVQTQYLKFAYDGTNIIGTFDGNTGNLLQSYAWGQDMGGGIGGLLVILDYSQSTTPTAYFPIYDGSGNIVGLHDAAGAVVAKYTYDPFGKQIGDSAVSRGSTTAAWTTTDSDQDLVLDLSNAVPVSEVKVSPNVTFTHVQYFDGTNWVDVADEVITTQGDSELVTFARVTTSKIRLHWEQYTAPGNVTATLEALDDMGFVGHFGWQSRWKDPEGGTLHTQYRDYSPSIGRWLTRDPAGESASTDLYVYCQNDPINRGDPDGLFDREFETGFLDLMSDEALAEWHKDSRTNNRRPTEVPVFDSEYQDYLTRRKPGTMSRQRASDQYQMLRRGYQERVLATNGFVLESSYIVGGAVSSFAMPDVLLTGAFWIGYLDLDAGMALGGVSAETRADVMGGYMLAWMAGLAAYSAAQPVEAQGLSWQDKLRQARPSFENPQTDPAKPNPAGPGSEEVAARLKQLVTGKGPRNGVRNGRLAGTVHPETGVPFDMDGVPMFDSIYDVELPSRLRGPTISDTEQMTYATEQLRGMLDVPPVQKQFTPGQLEQIRAGEPRIDGLIWDHHPDGVTLRLVNGDIHAKTGHTGGRANTGGRK